MSFHYSKQLRQEKKKKEALTEEQVYAHYHPNVEKGQMAIHFAVQQGRRDLRVAISQFCTNHDRYIYISRISDVYPKVSRTIRTSPRSRATSSSISLQRCLRQRSSRSAERSRPMSAQYLKINDQLRNNCFRSCTLAAH